MRFIRNLAIEYDPVMSFGSDTSASSSMAYSYSLIPMLLLLFMF